MGTQSGFLEEVIADLHVAVGEHRLICILGVVGVLDGVARPAGDVLLSQHRHHAGPRRLVIHVGV